MKTYENLFAVNLQRFRVEKGFSQRQLASMISFSDKSISKWERGGGIPDISILYKLSNIFGVRIDDFFAEDSIYYLGIDGGGTKTLFTLADKDMNVIRTELSEGCNPIDIGVSLAQQRLRTGITKICQGIPTSKISVFAGIAGGSSANNKEAMNDFLADFGFLSYECDTDNRNIISAGLGKKNGVSIILGTGICAFCQKDGERKKISGWGYLFDRGGSAYNVARDGIAAYYEALDGTGPSTLISDKLSHLHPDPQAFLGELYRGGKREIAGYASLVYEAAREGDRIAISIMERNMGFAASVIEVAASSLIEETVPVVLTGGLTKEEDTLIYIRKAFRHPERYDLQVLSCQPVHGALLIAKELAEKAAANK